jgi:hypothetical protein
MKSVFALTLLFLSYSALPTPPTLSIIRESNNEDGEERPTLERTDGKAVRGFRFNPPIARPAFLKATKKVEQDRVILDATTAQPLQPPLRILSTTGDRLNVIMRLLEHKK